MIIWQEGSNRLKGALAAQRRSCEATEFSTDAPELQKINNLHCSARLNPVLLKF